MMQINNQKEKDADFCSVFSDLKKKGMVKNMKNVIKFRLLSTGTNVFAELDGKTIARGVEELKFSARDEKGERRNKLELKIDLDSFEFMNDGEFDEKYQKLSGAATNNDAPLKNQNL